MVGLMCFFLSRSTKFRASDRGCAAGHPERGGDMTFAFTHDSDIRKTPIRSDSTYVGGELIIRGMKCASYVSSILIICLLQVS